jgi:tryptophan 2,3-dioxygenase
VQELNQWLARPVAARFPYAWVVAEFQRTGRHMVAGELLDGLDRARQLLVAMGAPAELPRRFVDCALDKRDGRYDYRSYVALDLLPSQPAHDIASWRDRLVLQLITDMLAFELGEAGDLLPLKRPDPVTVARRLRAALRCLPGAGRTPPVGGIRADAERWCELARAQTDPGERLRLRISMLPVDLLHDEYMFIRVLQASEVTLALVGCTLERVVGALAVPDAKTAARGLAAATEGFGQLRLLFSLMATMDRDAFQRFRSFTEGASAIQSDSYKRIESLCRRPDEDRLNSVAYSSVPAVRAAIWAGARTIDDTLAESAPLLSRAELALVHGQMDQFAAALRRWRQTHYSLAVRMLGDRAGSGYTNGTPYLEQVRDIPVFRLDVPQPSSR